MQYKFQNCLQECAKFVNNIIKFTMYIISHCKYVFAINNF